MSPVMSDVVDPVRALEHNLWGLWSRFGRGEGCVLHEEEDSTWFDTPIPSVPYNADRIPRGGAVPDLRATGNGAPVS